jgi:hypothetical protein
MRKKTDPTHTQMKVEKRGRQLVIQLVEIVGVVRCVITPPTSDSACRKRISNVIIEWSSPHKMMMMPFNCSYRNKNEPSAINPSLG